MIALLAMDLDMLIAQLAEVFFWKLVILALDFLQTQNVGIMCFQKIFHQPNAQSDRINVPGG